MTLENRTDVHVSPHIPHSGAKRGTHLVYKPVVSETPSDDSVVAAQSTQLNTGGLPLTLGPVRGSDNRDVHKSLSTADRSSGTHTPVAHELRNALATARTLCNQLEIADMRPEMRTALWLREQILVALLELEGYAEVTES